jgi:hypothetical protein
MHGQGIGVVVAVSASPAHTLGKPNRAGIRLLARLGVEGDAHLGETVQHRSRTASDPSQPNLRQVHLVHLIHARRLVADFGLPVEFVCGSFIPAGAEAGLTRGHDFAWLSRGETRPAYEVMGLGVEEFDLVFAYPWPEEEALIEGLFEGHARAGALLLTYHADGALRLRQLTAGQVDAVRG